MDVLLHDSYTGVGSFLFGHGSGHSIARPIAFGNRVPPQRTVLRETTDSIYAPDDTQHCRAIQPEQGKTITTTQ